jgi:hypothetical protein
MGRRSVRLLDPTFYKAMLTVLTLHDYDETEYKRRLDDEEESDLPSCTDNQEGANIGA